MRLYLFVAWQVLCYTGGQEQVFEEYCAMFDQASLDTLLRRVDVLGRQVEQLRVLPVAWCGGAAGCAAASHLCSAACARPRYHRRRARSPKRSATFSGDWMTSNRKGPPCCTYWTRMSEFGTSPATRASRQKSATDR